MTESTRGGASGPAADTTAILDNLIWIVAQFAADRLWEIDDLPVLELAKHISIARRAAA